MGHRISAVMTGTKKIGCWLGQRSCSKQRCSQYKENPCKMAATNVGVSIGGCVGMIVIRCKERALRYERMMGITLKAGPPVVLS